MTDQTRDIVEALRGIGWDSWRECATGVDPKDCHEAADHIEALTKRVEDLEEALKQIVGPYDRDSCMTGERYSDAVWIAKAALSNAARGEEI
jgi:hypothetical protein